MVWIASSIRWWLAHIAKQIQVAIFENRQYSQTIVSCLEDIQIWQEYGHNRLLCSKDESGCGNAKLWRDADFRES